MREVIILGSGMGSLTAAAVLAKKGMKPLIIEQNWIPGGCTTSYPRKGYVFEAGATTLVGLDDHMPLRYLLDEIGIDLKARKLNLPMQVHLSNGKIINRYQEMNKWIAESEKHFGGGQKEFWEKAYQLSQFVWKSSTKYLHFPPNKITDYFNLALNANLMDLVNARYAFYSTHSMLGKINERDNGFQEFIDQQLLITAQNPSQEVNFLFGAAALCYTNYGNYYIDGGMRNLVNPIVDYILSKGGEIIYREGVTRITKTSDRYKVSTKSKEYESKYVISGIPLNNLSAIAPEIIKEQTKDKLLTSKKLYSAFQMGIVFKSNREYESIHHQFHLDTPLIQIGARSIFLSLNHIEDTTRSSVENIRIASVSTHISDPENTHINSEELEKAIILELDKHGLIPKKDIVFSHSSGPKSWNKWTGRAYGFVGGYPQFFGVKPWQMVESRLDNHRLYHCGDTAYPGQGIPGATLSGIIAAEKLKSDWL